MRPPREVVPPGPGQESVWTYPRPPRIDPSGRRVEVHLGGHVIVSTTRGIRVLETSHPPVWYLPFEDFAPDVLVPSEGVSYCEFKGMAHYFDLVSGDVRVQRAGWTYPLPARGYEQLVDHVAVYPERMERCTVDGEVVRAQEGDFYGGWITSEIVGPFKGAPDTRGW